jgi:hypothetical protein
MLLKYLKKLFYYHRLILQMNFKDFKDVRFGYKLCKMQLPELQKNC